MFIELGDYFPEFELSLCTGGARETIEFATNQMAPGVATKCVGRKEKNVGEHDECADAATKRAVPVECEKHVVPQECQNDGGKVEHVAVQILQDKWK